MSTPGIQPIFIGGCERSGTTFLGSLLGAAPGAITVPESPFRFECALAEARGYLPTEPLRRILEHYSYKEWCVPGDLDGCVSPSAPFREAVEALVRRYAGTHGVEDPRVWVDHTPINVLWGLTELERFPEARFVHLVRDGRAVAASIMPLTWGPNAIHSAARLWVDRVAHGTALETSGAADRVIRVRYEDLLAAPEPTLRRLCAFCEVEFTPQMLEGGRFELPSTTQHQHGLVGKPPQAARAAAWETELSARQVEIFESIAGQMLALLGYPTRYGVGARWMRRKEMLRLTAYDAVRRRLINPYRDRRRWAADGTGPR